MKKNIDIANIEIKVNNVKHKEGEVYINFHGKNESEKDFINEISKNVHINMETTLVQPTKTVFIKDMSHPTDKSALEEAVVDTLNTTTDNRQIQMAQKPNKSNLIYAFVKLPIDQANKLIQAQRIRLGWNYCRVEETNQPKLFLNCYKYGHSAKNCTIEPRERSCLNCCSTEHDIKGSQNL